MAIQGNVPAGTRKRHIALCISKWSSSALTWAWLRQYFLNPDTDELVIVHAGKDDNWKAGGPLGADVDTALAAWPHYIVKLHGSLQSNIAKVVRDHGIDVVVLDDDFPRQSAIQISSVSDWVRANITCPFVIVRAAAVRNERLRLASRPPVGAPPQPALSPASAPGRKVAVAYSTFGVGSHLIELAKELVLLPQDEVFVVHCFPGGSAPGAAEKSVIRQTKSILMRTLTLGRAPEAGGASGAASPPAGAEEAPSPPAGDAVAVTEEASLAFGAAELAGHAKVHLGVVLRGDPRTSLTAFCVSEGIELLVISTRMAGKLKKTLTGGSVSGYLIDKAPCPCLVAPMRSLGMGTEEEEGPLSPMTSATDGQWAAAAGASPPGPLSPTAGAAVADLQAQLAERDRTIEALRRELEELRAAAARGG